MVEFLVFCVLVGGHVPCMTQAETSQQERLPRWPSAWTTEALECSQIRPSLGGKDDLR